MQGVKPKPGSVRGSIKYCVVKDQQLQSETLEIADFTIDPYAVTRIKMAENLSLGVCFDGFLKESDYLYSMNEAGHSQTDLFSRNYGFSIRLTNSTNILRTELDHNLYIDCIELVPHK